jgi:hypothetical protein
MTKRRKKARAKIAAMMKARPKRYRLRGKRGRKYV